MKKIYLILLLVSLVLLFPTKAEAKVCKIVPWECGGHSGNIFCSNDKRLVLKYVTTELHPDCPSTNFQASCISDKACAAGETGHGGCCSDSGCPSGFECNSIPTTCVLGTNAGKCEEVGTIPAATSVPVATATPVPTRPALCKSTTASKTSLAPGESLTITSTANTSDIKRFTYAFYNLDNDTKPIFFTANTHYIVANPPPPINPPSNTITVKYDDLNKPDLNWNNKKPIKIHVLGYFTNSAGGFSLPEGPCVVEFTMIYFSWPTCARHEDGDANCDGKIDGIDYSLWLNRQCTTGCQTENLKADFDHDGDVDGDDYSVWFNKRGTALL